MRLFSIVYLALQQAVKEGGAVPDEVDVRPFEDGPAVLKQVALVTCEKNHSENAVFKLHF